MAPKSKVEVLIERPFADPLDRLKAMQDYEDMVNYLRAEKAKWVLVYCDVVEKDANKFTYNQVHLIVWKFQIPNESVRVKFNDIFGAS